MSAESAEGASDSIGARGVVGDVVLLVSAVLIAIGYLRLGVGHVLDDWFALRNAHFLGSLRAAGSDQIAARPVGSLVYAVVFGLLGQSIAPVLLLMAVINAGSAMLLRRLLQGVTTAAVALAAAWLWLVVPSVTSVEVWASASNISVALVCGLGALRLVQAGPLHEAPRRGGLRLLAVAVLALAAVLSYEALVVLTGAGAALLLAERRDRARIRLVAVTVVASAAAFGWVLLHWHPRKNVTDIWGDVIQVLPANLGPGIAQGLAWVVLGVPVLIVTLLALLPSFRSVVEPSVRLIALGWFTMVLGVVPFIKYTYAPAGAGDRVNVISSLGGAMLLAATIDVALRHRSRWLPLVTVGVAALTLPTRVHEMRPWSQGAADAERIMAAVPIAARAGPGDPVVLGPHLVDRGGVTAMQLSYIAQAAIQLALDDPDAVGSLTESLEEFEEAEGVKIDLRLLLDDP